jgi:tRNA(Arg) A34 adenosine deaminase TadA
MTADQRIDDAFFMQRALVLAAAGAELGEVPVGAVLVMAGQIVGEGFNQPISACDPTAHAEVVALRQASALVGNYRLPGSTLYVTLEPCTMCVGALVHARVERLVFGTVEPKAGSVVSRAQLLDASYFNHQVRYEAGVLVDACAACMRTFFQSRRKKNSQDGDRQNKDHQSQGEYS